MNNMNNKQLMYSIDIDNIGKLIQNDSMINKTQNSFCSDSSSLSDFRLILHFSHFSYLDLTH